MRVSIASHFPYEFEETEEVRRSVEDFGGDPLNLVI